jgi:hypothetical protein
MENIIVLSVLKIQILWLVFREAELSFRLRKGQMGPHHQDTPAGEDYIIVLEIHVLAVGYFQPLQPFDL